MLRRREYWNHTKARLKEKFPQLTDEDVTYRDGKEDLMLIGLQHKLDMTKEELRSTLISLDKF
jgi:hypothetical protein